MTTLLLGEFAAPVIFMGLMAASCITIMNIVHQVGCTTRADQEGCAVTFVTDNDRSLLKAINFNSCLVLYSVVLVCFFSAAWNFNSELLFTVIFFPTPPNFAGMIS
ncbi:uncharacterized protein LOC110278619 [Arachis duranensis]|uniref:Uncharacterized protein LOC110278619 n=1 Tax=Arachis duranensis TaxID=130453 RepID=A0A6P5N8X6_ARADU|nr:uncharacterized protein LOC110278619 [Arachis duranensis]